MPDLRHLIALPLACLAGIAPAYAQSGQDFFAAALCQPPYSMEGAMALYTAAAKLGKADSSTLGAEVYPLPAPVSRDGFVTSQVMFAGSAVGVLVDGHVAAQLARRYGLAPEKSHLLGASSLGFSRRLPDDQQGMKEAGVIFLVAREGPALKDKTMLACEFISHEDLKGLKTLDDMAK